MKRRIVWINIGLALLVIAAAAGAYFWLFAPKSEPLTGRTVAVQKGTVSETVTATGTVATAGTLNLSFHANGTVKKVKVSEGDAVKAGKTLVTLDDTTAKQGLANAKSSYVQAVNDQQHSTVSVSQAQLSVSQARTAIQQAERNADINKRSYQQAIDSAKANVADAEAKWNDSCLDPNGVCPDSDAWAQLRAAEADVTSAKTAYDQAVQTASADETTNGIKVNQANVDLASAQAKQNNDCTTSGSSSSQCSSAVSGVQNAQQQLELARNAATTAAAQSQQSLVNADQRITQANITLRKLQGALKKAAADSKRSAQEALDSAKLNQEKGLTSDQQAIDKAKQSLTSSELSVESVTTGSGATTSSQAQIDVAKAGLVAATKTLDETVLKAPIGGVVAAVSATEGSPAAAGTTIVTLLPKDKYEITASFSEADALKVKVGQKATVTFDALPSAEATGSVTSIDLVPTTSTSSNVTTYGVTITLDTSPDGLKQGMSASVVVTTNEAAGVLWAPTAAITSAGGQSIVTIRKDGKDTKAQVTTGLAGDTGTELTSGVTEGDELVIATTTSGSGSGFPFGGIPGGFGTGTRIRTNGGPPAGGAG